MQSNFEISRLDEETHAYVHDCPSLRHDDKFELNSFVMKPNSARLFKSCARRGVGRLSESLSILGKTIQIESNGCILVINYGNSTWEVVSAGLMVD
jgi:hypothetical protein